MKDKRKEQEEELELLNKGIEELKKELLPKLNSIYEECLEKEEPNITFKSSFDGLTTKHLEYLALEGLSRFFKNPSLIKSDIDKILEVPEDFKEYATGFYILMNFSLLFIYEEDLD